MGSEWRTSTWGDEISLEYGKALRNYDKDRGLFRVFGSNGPIGWTAQPLAPGPGVILGRKGAYRGVEFSREPFFVIDTAYYVVPKTELDMRWLYYAIKHHKLGEIDDGSPIPSTTRSAVYVRELDIPPPAEQKAIACILGSLDDKIELNRRMNKTLEDMARAIFKSWFVDFDLVHAKAAVRREHPDWSNAQVSRAACPNLKSEIAELFPEEFENSKLGQIPKGWKESKLGNVADVNWGDTNVTKKSYVENGHKAFSAKGADGFLSYYDYDRIGIVLSAIGANSGYTWLARGKWSCIKNTIRFWATDDNISTEYLFFATRGNKTWPLRGSAQPFISQTDARNLLILNPGKSLGKLFGQHVEPFFAKIDENETQISTLSATRDTLLPKLISGELPIKDAERIAGRCLV